MPDTYDGPFPPKGCNGCRYALYDGHDGLLFIVKRTAVFWFAWEDRSILIDRWRHEPQLQLIQ